MLPRVVSLFSGAGGLDLGFQQAGFEIEFAIDSSAAAVHTHQRNFPLTKSVAADLAELGPDGVEELIIEVVEPGTRLAVIGGPPCQGFSRANNGSTTSDPRNALPALYLAIVERLKSRFDVEFVLFENVQGIKDSKHADTFAGILTRLEDLELHPRVEDHSALDFGVAQTRNRVIISGFSSKAAAELFVPKKIPRRNLTVRSAIGGLPGPAFFSRDLARSDIPHHENHWTMQPRSVRFQNPQLLSTTGRTFRRLEWDRPSPTVAYGHREIHVHPSGDRRLSIFEAMLLQGFPAHFVLEGTLSDQVEQVSNAVPPPLAEALARAAAEAIESAARTQRAGVRALPKGASTHGQEPMANARTQRGEVRSAE